MLERHKLLMGRTQDRAGQNNGSIGVFWRSFNGIIGHIRYTFRGLKITHNHGHSSLYCIGACVGYPWASYPNPTTTISGANGDSDYICVAVVAIGGVGTKSRLTRSG